MWYEQVILQRMIRNNLSRGTTVRQPCNELAVTAFHAMLERQVEPNLPPRHVMIMPQLVVRESSGTGGRSDERKRSEWYLRKAPLQGAPKATSPIALIFKKEVKKPGMWHSKLS